MSAQLCSNGNGKGQIKRQNSGLPRMESLARIGSIPIVETGVKTAEHVYVELKKRNGLLNWSFETAEGVIFAAVDSVRPAVKIIEGPLSRIDQILCSSLDIVEQRVPSVYLPPQLMYYNTKEYMSDRLVRPVLRRAGSVKQIRTAVLENRVSNYASDCIDGAIDAADKYVEKYLPTDEAGDQVDSANNVENGDKESRAIHTFHKGQRLSRKLKRRITQRTILEARALKKHSKEAIHILIYAAELIATDPKLALQKIRELWTYLSLDEPENQARPQTIEELIVLLTRESARRLVHLVNFTRNTATKVPNTVGDLLHQFLDVSDSLVKVVHLDKAKSAAVNETYTIITNIQILYENLQSYTSVALERLAVFLAGRIESSNENCTVKKGKQRNVTKLKSNNNPGYLNNANGVY